MTLAALPAIVALVALTAPVVQEQRDSASCQSDIVSSTVVATFCGHRQGDNLVLDLLILWRGRPGWFQWNGVGRRGSSGSSSLGGRTKGAVSHSTSYGDVTIAFEANFDSAVATIGQTAIKLDRLNTVIVDDVDSVGRVTATRWTEPVLPLVGDWNLVLAKRSSELVRDLRCSIPMPAPPPVPQVPVLTVCDRLNQR